MKINEKIIYALSLLVIKTTFVSKLFHVEYQSLQLDICGLDFDCYAPGL